MTDELPAEFLLDGYPPAIRETGRTLRSLIFPTVPGAVETVRPGWRWIAYSLPERAGVRNFAWIGPERKHIHLGFEHGTLLADPEHSSRAPRNGSGSSAISRSSRRSTSTRRSSSTISGARRTSP